MIGKALALWPWLFHDSHTAAQKEVSALFAKEVKYESHVAISLRERRVLPIESFDSREAYRSYLISLLYELGLTNFTGIDDTAMINTARLLLLSGKGSLSRYYADRVQLTIARFIGGAKLEYRYMHPYSSILKQEYKEFWCSPLNVEHYVTLQKGKQNTFLGQLDVVDSNSKVECVDPGLLPASGGYRYLGDRSDDEHVLPSRTRESFSFALVEIPVGSVLCYDPDIAVLKEDIFLRTFAPMTGGHVSIRGGNVLKNFIPPNWYYDDKLALYVNQENRHIPDRDANIVGNTLEDSVLWTTNGTMLLTLINLGKEPSRFFCREINPNLKEFV